MELTDQDRAKRDAFLAYLKTIPWKNSWYVSTFGVGVESLTMQDLERWLQAGKDSER